MAPAATTWRINRSSVPWGRSDLSGTLHLGLLPIAHYTEKCKACRRSKGTGTGPSCGRTWWAHFEFTRINIAHRLDARGCRVLPRPLEGFAVASRTIRVIVACESWQRSGQA